MTRVFKPADEREARDFLTSHCNRCVRSLASSCEILEAVTVNDATDPDYPSQWVLDDEGRPTCTAFEPREKLSWPFGGAPVPVGQDESTATAQAAEAQPETATSVASEEVAACEAPGPHIEAVQAVTIGKGVIEACRLRRDKRSWTVPYAQVAELFEDAPDALREVLHVPTPTKARVHHGKAHVTITARSSQDGSSVSSSVRLRIVRRSA